MKALEQMRSFEEFQSSLRNFHSWLSGVVPGATDLDCVIERREQFLVMELKPWTKGIWLNYGQHLALYHLSKMENFDVYLIGEENENLHVLHYNNAAPPDITKRKGKSGAWFTPRRFVPTTIGQLQELVRAWWDDATEQGAVRGR